MGYRCGEVQYIVGILDWSDQELSKGNGCEDQEEVDNVWCTPQKGECVRLYMMRKDGGRGLISVYDHCEKEEELGLFGYAQSSDEWMLKVAGETLLVGERRFFERSWDCRCIGRNAGFCSHWDHPNHPEDT